MVILMEPRSSLQAKEKVQQVVTFANGRRNVENHNAGVYGQEQSRCGCHADLLDKLRFKYEELVGIGVTISSTEYATCIIGSLPSHYQHHLSTIEASARASALATSAIQATAENSQISTTTFSISPELLIQLATEEYDRIQSAPSHRGPKTFKADTGVALSAQGTTSSGRGGKTPQKPRLARNGKPFGTCWNCGGKGHLSKDCPSPSQGALSSAEKGKKKGRRKSSSQWLSECRCYVRGGWGLVCL